MICKAFKICILMTVYYLKFAGKDYIGINARQSIYKETWIRSKNRGPNCTLDLKGDLIS